MEKKRRFNLWLSEADINNLKKSAKLEGRSVNGFVLYKVLKEKKKK